MFKTHDTAVTSVVNVRNIYVTKHIKCIDSNKKQLTTNYQYRKNNFGSSLAIKQQFYKNLHIIFLYINVFCNTVSAHLLLHNFVWSL